MQELGYEPTLSGLSSLNGDMVANSCRRTLTTLIQVELVMVMMMMVMMKMVMMVVVVNHSISIQNAMENVENKILEVLEDVGEKMAPVIKVILVTMMIMITMMIMMKFSSSKIVLQNFKWA